MKSQVLFLVLGVTAGSLAVYLSNRSTPTAPEAEAATPAKVAAAAAKEAKPAAGGPTKKADAVVATTAPAPTGAWAKLSERFGQEKTAKSEKIAKNVAGIIDKGMEMASEMAKSSGADNVGAMAGKRAVEQLTSRLGLDPTQQASAATIIEKNVNDRMKTVQDLATAMRNEPEQMMEMVLAGDALARKEITQSEYDELTKPTRTMLQGVSQYVMGGFTPGNNLSTDSALTQELGALLTPEQQAKFAEMTTEWEAQAADNKAGEGEAGGGGTRGGGRRGPAQMMAFLNGNLPVMELDKMEQTVSSVSQMANAASIMMQAADQLRKAQKQNENNEQTQ